MASKELELSGKEAQVEYVENDAVVDAIDAMKHRDLDSVENTRPGSFVWLCAAATAIGGMLFGYDTGVISGVLVVLGTDLDGHLLSSAQKELITSLCAAGALIGALIAGITADKYGRRPAIWFASVLFTIGAIVQASSFSIVQMAFGRTLIGLGVGSASMVSNVSLLCNDLLIWLFCRSSHCISRRFHRLNSAAG